MHRLNLAHTFLLLEHHDESGHSLLEDAPRRQRFGLCGAVVGELHGQGRLRKAAAAADRYTLSLDPAPLTGALALAEDALRGEPPMRLSTCILRLPFAPLRAALLEELVDMGALRREEERVWVVFRRTRWRATPDSPERTLVEHLRAYLDEVTADAPPSRSDFLLSLLQATDLLSTIWTPEQVAADAEVIEARARRAPIGALVRDLVDDPARS